jgi:hypothetical protein
LSGALSVGSLEMRIRKEKTYKCFLCRRKNVGEREHDPHL